MSSLLSSLYEPVVRQARRFSAAPADDGGEGARTALSHVSDTEQLDEQDNRRQAAVCGRDAPADDDAAAAATTSSTAANAAERIDPVTFPSSFDQLRNRLPRPEFIQRLRRFMIHSATATPTWFETENTAVASHAAAPVSLPYPRSSSQTAHDDTSPIVQRSIPLDPPYNLSGRSRTSSGSPAQPQRPNMAGSALNHSRRDTARLSRNSSSNALVSAATQIGEMYNASTMTAIGSLPEDDGMADLRRKIHHIRDMAASSEEKALRMHQLMTAEYAAHRLRMRPSSPASIISAERPFTPGSPQSDMIVTPATSPPAPRAQEPADPTNPFNVVDGDLQPSYRVKAEHETVDEHMDTDAEPAEEELELGCAHYKRNVKVQCFDCRRWFPCRHCHDAQADHKLNRKMTENMLCMLCQTPQPAGQECVKCGMEAACYYCGICKLWDDDSSKRIYHCPDCGICRRGEGLGKDYVHCKRCNVCITISHHSSHRCIERATECDCPICGDYMFTSSLSVSALPCGHYMHKTCYKQYMAVSYKCPICQRSAVNMELQWRKLDNAIESQPMPAQFRDTKAEIQCNDCGSKGVSKYHWLGNKCGNCDSYNTTELRLLGGREAEDAHRRLMRAREPPIELPATVAAAANLLPRNATEQQHLHPFVTRRSSSMTMNGRSTRSAGQYRQASAGNRSPTSYFLNEQAEDESLRRGSFSALAALPSAGILMSPVELLQRVSRSLSPMRHYLEFGNDHEEGVTDDDVMGFWGGDARSGGGSGGEDEYWEDEDSEEEDGSQDEEVESEEEEDDDEDEDGEEGNDRWEGMDLPGHR